MRLNKKSKNILIGITILSQLNGFIAFGHSGRTDSNGGHRDNKNISGLGSYHYHHGYSAHLHPNGICPYESSSASSTSSSSNKAALEKAAEDEGYNQGYQDGKVGKVNNPSKYSTSYRSSFNFGYESGYEKGSQELAAEKETIKLKAEDDGYQDGYKNNPDNSVNYSGQHVSVYQTAYQSGYTKGRTKREKEVKAVEEEALKLGETHGYNKESHVIDYNGNYRTEYEAAYKNGLAIGEQKLETDLLTISQEMFKLGTLGLSVSERDYPNVYLKEEATNSYNKGKEIYNEIVLNRPVFRQSFSFYNEYANDKKYIQIESKEGSEEAFIQISRKWSGGVKNITLLLDNLFEDGLENEDVNILITNVLSQEVINCYEEEQKVLKKSDSSSEDEYMVTTMKRVQKSEEGLLRKFYIIEKVKSDQVIEVEITRHLPWKIKKLETL